MRWLVLGILVVVVLAIVAYALADRGPTSYTALYRRALAERLDRDAPGPVLTEADLATLPAPVARYLRVTGALGLPRPGSFRVAWRGRIRGGPDEPWMAFTAEQHNFLDEPARFFHMRARRAGLPVDVYHAFEGDSARMGARLLSLFQVMESRGPELTRAETVTLFNDLAIFAPGALLRPEIGWEPIDDRSARGSYTAGANTVTATLHFNEAGELVDFVSDDRLAASGDGGVLTPVRWSTPLHAYREFGRLHLASRGEGRWHPPEGDYAYFEGEILAVEWDPRR